MGRRTPTPGGIRTGAGQRSAQARNTEVLHQPEASLSLRGRGWKLSQPEDVHQQPSASQPYPFPAPQKAGPQLGFQVLRQRNEDAAPMAETGRSGDAGRKMDGADTDRVCQARAVWVSSRTGLTGGRGPWRVGARSMSAHMELTRPARGWGLAGVAGGGWSPGGGREAPRLYCRRGWRPRLPRVPTHQPPGGALTCDCFSCSSCSSSSFL